MPLEGGSSDSQKEFLEALSSTGSLKRTQDRLARKQPPIANNFALGFTYLDILDADQEGMEKNSFARHTRSKF